MRDLLFKCPGCAAGLAFDRKLVGKSISCPSCKGQIEVPVPDASFECPSCGVGLHVRSDATGRFECPSCKGEVLIEGDESPAPEAREPEGSRLRFKERPAERDHQSATRHSSPSCPRCRALVGASDVICVGCGTDLRTGMALRTDQADRRPSQYGSVPWFRRATILNAFSATGLALWLFGVSPLAFLVLLFPSVVALSGDVYAKDKRSSALKTWGWNWKLGPVLLCCITFVLSTIRVIEVLGRSAPSRPEKSAVPAVATPPGAATAGSASEPTLGSRPPSAGDIAGKAGSAGITAKLIMIASETVPELERSLGLNLDILTGQALLTSAQSAALMGKLRTSPSAYVVGEAQLSAKPGIEQNARAVRDLAYPAEGRQEVREIGTAMDVVADIGTASQDVGAALNFRNVAPVGCQRVRTYDETLFEVFNFTTILTLKPGRFVLMRGSRSRLMSVDGVNYADHIPPALRGRSVDYLLLIGADALAPSPSPSTEHRRPVLVACQLFDLGASTLAELVRFVGAEGMETPSALPQATSSRIMNVLNSSSDAQKLFSATILASSDAESEIRWIQEAKYDTPEDIACREIGVSLVVKPVIGPDHKALNLDLNLQLVSPSVAGGRQAFDSAFTVSASPTVQIDPSQIMLLPVATQRGFLPSGHRCYMAISLRNIQKEAPPSEGHPAIGVNNGPSGMRKLLHSARLPGDVEFRQASLEDIVAFLGKCWRKNAPPGKTISFVLRQPPPGVEVTLQASAMPFDQVLDLVAEASGCHVEAEGNVIAICPGLGAGLPKEAEDGVGAENMTAMRNLLRSTVIPEVEFRQANVNDIVAFLNAAFREHGPKAKTVNIVLVPRTATGAKVVIPEITMLARELPLDKVLDVVTAAAGCAWTAEGDTAVIRPASAADRGGLDQSGRADAPQAQANDARGNGEGQPAGNEERDPESRALLQQGLDSAGRGDFAAAARYYRLAAERGSAWGQNNLGCSYMAGNGVPKDMAEGARWLAKAAGQGLREAQAALGTCYVQGLGVEKNEAEGARWYTKAAEKGDAVAQRQLSAMYAVGMGVPKSNEQAVRWAREAASRGDPQATEWIAKWDARQGAGGAARQEAGAPPGANPTMGHRNPWGKAGERVVGTYATFREAYRAKQGMRGLVNANMEGLEEQVINAGNASMTIQRPPEYRIEADYERGVWLLIEQKF